MTRVITSPGGLAFLGGLGITVLLVLFVFARNVPSVEAEVPGEWPPFTMTYERDGSAFRVGDQEYATRETHLLQFRGPTSWTDTVIAAPSISTPYGPITAIGSYQELRGNRFVMFDATSGTRSEYAIEDGNRQVAHPALHPMYAQSVKLAVGGRAGTTVASEARLCERSTCTTSANGISYEVGGQEHIFTESRGIPLKTMDLRVISLSID